MSYFFLSYLQSPALNYSVASSDSEPEVAAVEGPEMEEEEPAASQQLASLIEAVSLTGEPATEDSVAGLKEELRLELDLEQEESSSSSSGHVSSLTCMYFFLGDRLETWQSGVLNLFKFYLKDTTMVAAGAVKEEEEELGPEQEELEPLLVPQPAHLAAVAQGAACLAALQDEVEGVLHPPAAVNAAAAVAAVVEPVVADESVMVLAERRATRSTKPVLAGPLPPASRRNKKKN